jgi:general secretion pathway protein H
MTSRAGPEAGFTLFEISFFASGMSCGGVIALNRLDAAYEIRTNWLTGRIEVAPRDRFNP